MEQYILDKEVIIQQVGDSEHVYWRVCELSPLKIQRTLYSCSPEEVSKLRDYKPD